jgi:hypothetical protein
MAEGPVPVVSCPGTAQAESRSNAQAQKAAEGFGVANRMARQTGCSRRRQLVTAWLKAGLIFSCDLARMRFVRLRALRRSGAFPGPLRPQDRQGNLPSCRFVGSVQPWGGIRPCPASLAPIRPIQVPIAGTDWIPGQSL